MPIDQETTKPSLFKRILSIFLKILALLIVVAILLVAFLYLKPIEKLNLQNVNNLSFQESKDRFEKFVLARDNDSSINPVCKSKLLEHSQKVEKVIILYHGFTNCPAQFSLLGQQLFEQGYNVYIPRIPLHGLKNLLNEDFANLKSTDLTSSIAESIEIATGLGNKITIFGISGGGVMAAYGGYFYPQIQNVFIAAPLFTPGEFDTNTLSPLINAIDTVPNLMRWWDESAKEKVEGPSYAYPRYSTKAAGAFIKLTQELKTALEKKQVDQKGKRLVLLTKENDLAVNNKTARYMLEKWTTYPDTTIVAYQFSSEKVTIHDFIDPNQTKANIDYVYPIIKSLIEKV